MMMMMVDCGRNDDGDEKDKKLIISLSKRFIIWDVLLLFFSACPDGKFGAWCTNTCHCADGDNCNPNSGFCETGECATQWSGQACQGKLGATKHVTVLMVIIVIQTLGFVRWGSVLHIGVVQHAKVQ